jgi:probable rRNA maturation factor
MTTGFLLNLHIDQPYTRSVTSDQLERALRLTLQTRHQTRAATINLTITNNETIQQLNYQYRGIDSPTDVLTFPNIPDPEFPLLDQNDLGDIIIAYPVAESQATARGHTLMEELVLLAIHGTLHLLGFDHDSPTAKAEMWTVQQEILDQLGLGHVDPTET